MSIAGTPFGIPNSVDQYVVQRGLLALPSTVATGVLGNIRHTLQGALGKTVVVLDSPLDILLGTTGARAGGTKLFDMPACSGVPLASRLKLAGVSLTLAAAASTAGEIGLGTTVGSGGVAVLGGTAAFENILEGGIPALGNIAAAGALASFVAGDGPRDILGNFAAAWSVYVNAATTLATAATPTSLRLAAGSVFEVTWSILAS